MLGVQFAGPRVAQLGTRGGQRGTGVAQLGLDVSQVTALLAQCGAQQFQRPRAVLHRGAQGQRRQIAHAMPQFDGHGVEEQVPVMRRHAVSAGPGGGGVWHHKRPVSSNNNTMITTRPKAPLGP